MRAAEPERAGRTGRVLAIANQKGGVGKTTTAINLATAMAAVGRRALLIDLDPQGNASTGLGVARADRRLTAYDLLIGRANLLQAAIPTKVPGLALVPATVDLSAAEIELVEDPRRAFRLRDALDGPGPGVPGGGAAPDIVLVDCPPSLGLLTVNALAAADAVLVPLQCEFFALEGLSLLLRTIERVRHAYNPGLALEGVVLTMMDRRNNLAGQVETDVRGFLADRVYDTVIPRNVRVSEAPSHGQPVLVYDLKCPGSVAYLDLARELLRRDGGAAGTAGPAGSAAVPRVPA